MSKEYLKDVTYIDSSEEFKQAIIEQFEKIQKHIVDGLVYRNWELKDAFAYLYYEDDISDTYKIYGYIDEKGTKISYKEIIKNYQKYFFDKLEEDLGNFKNLRMKIDFNKL